MRVDKIVIGREVHIIFDPPISTTSYTAAQKDQLKEVVNAQIASNYESIKHLSQVTDQKIIAQINEVEQKRRAARLA